MSKVTWYTHHVGPFADEAASFCISHTGTLITVNSHWWYGQQAIVREGKRLVTVQLEDLRFVEDEQVDNSLEAGRLKIGNTRTEIDGNRQEEAQGRGEDSGSERSAPVPIDTPYYCSCPVQQFFPTMPNYILDSQEGAGGGEDQSQNDTRETAQDKSLSGAEEARPQDLPPGREGTGGSFSLRSIQTGRSFCGDRTNPPKTR